jgi:hypothetical protein
MGPVSDRSERTPRETLGWRLLSVGAALGTLTVFTALIPAEIGVWPRFESGGMAMLLSAGICAIALTIIWFDDRPTVETALSHPIVLAVLLVALASAVLAPFVDYPWLSIFGYPLIGEGALRYGAMAAFFAAAIVLRGDAPRFRLLLACLLIGSIGGTVALALGVRGEFVSLDIAGILVVSAWVGAWYLQPPAWGGWRIAVCAVAVAPILILSSNDTAVATTLLVSLPASVLIYLNLKRQFVSVGAMRVIAAAGLIAMPFAALLVVWLVPMFTDALPSITSRKYTYQLVFAALRADPSVIFAGQGWGEIVMTLDRFRTFSDAVLWDGSWDGAARDLPHSHNLLLEALFGGGIVAVVGVLAVLAIPVLLCRERELPVALFALSMFAGIGAIWPQVAMTVGPVALALGIVGATGTGPRPMPTVGRVFAWGLPVFASILIASGGWLVSEGISYRNSVADVRGSGTASPHACALIPNSGAYGDLKLAQGLTKAYRPVFRRAQHGIATTESEDRLIAAFLCSAERRALHSISPSLHLALESFRGDVSTDAGRTADIAKYEPVLSGWSDKLIRLLNAAPTRTDMTFTFYAVRKQGGAWETIGSLARALKNANPDDPIANWYMGQYLLSKGDPGSRAAGFTALRKSLNDGIKRLILVPPALEAEILKATGAVSAGSVPGR